MNHVRVRLNQFFSIHKYEHPLSSRHLVLEAFKTGDTKELYFPV